ncbi:GDP-mannose 4,6-dehydratase [Exiguobacterium alkaliphilum]|uniref:GDP-mannose 4,6-dehydratase n=1 Tax=Exiguobacterium alkaliphilum TaxID=1428684 RepID=UPI0034641879
MNILVTGGAGFIGSNLCDFLIDAGHKVYNLDNFNDFYDPIIKRRNIEHHLHNPNYVLLEGDIRDEMFLDKVFAQHEFGMVIHLAAMAGVRPSIENPYLYETVNVLGTINLLEKCKAKGVRKFICASSSSVYGNNKKIPFAETDIVDFSISPYASTKKSCEVTSHVYHKLYGIDIVLLRFFTVYGPRQRPDLAIHKFTQMIDKGMPIPFYGDGGTKRDYTYIDDIIDGINKTINYLSNNENVYEIINLGESKTISLSQMVSTLEKHIGKNAIINKMENQPGDVYQTFADITKAKELIAYNPVTNFDTGIKKFISWYDSTQRD